MNLNKFLVLAVVGILFMGIATAFVLYKGESEKNKLLRTENLKTSEEAQAEIKTLKEEIKKTRDQGSDEKQKLLEQITRFSQEKDNAVQAAEALEKNFEKEKEMSGTVNEDITTIRNEVARIRKDSKESLLELDKSLQRKIRNYETRILSLEAQLDKAKSRLNADAERFHYNLGVVYTQNKDFDSAVTEFKTALSYNPRNAQAYYNLGIIFDDYFKDNENARYYYRSFLDLAQDSDDAESVKEWLADLDKDNRKNAKAENSY